MDVERFLRELPRALEDVSRFQAVLDDVPGLAKPNNLALLHVAARCLGEGEVYLEVGTFHGTSLISAMLGNDGEFVALDNWSMAEGSREQERISLAINADSIATWALPALDALARQGLPLDFPFSVE